VAALLVLSAAAFGQAANVQNGSAVLTATGGALSTCYPTQSVAGTCVFVPNLNGAYGMTFDEVPAGSPTTVSILVYGCMRGGACSSVLDTNSSTSEAIRPVTATTPYDVFVVVSATLTGGTTPTETINYKLSTANAHSSTTYTGSAPIVVTGTAISCPTCGTGSGNVAGPPSSTANDAAGFADTTGKVLLDLGTPWTNGSNITSGTVAASRVATLNQNTTGSAASLTVLTTLGDLLYENATPANTRLAGNTSATKNFLTQTGNGTISASPAWGTIAAGDLPTAIPIANVGSAGLSGTSPVTINAAGAIGCATCNVSNATVSSVTFTGDGTVLSSTPSTAVTTTGTLQAALANAAQNSVLAGPASGGAAAPSYQTAPTFSAANLTNFPTFNQSTTGTSGGLTGTPSITVNAITATTYNGGALSGTFTGGPTLSGNIAFTGTPTFSNTLALNTTGTSGGLTGTPNIAIGTLSATGLFTTFVGAGATPNIQATGSAANTGMFFTTTAGCWSSAAATTACEVSNGMEVGSARSFGFGSGVGASSGEDTAITRDSAGVMDIGNGTIAAVGNKYGSINLTNLTSTGQVTANAIVANSVLPTSSIGFFNPAVLPVTTSLPSIASFATLSTNALGQVIGQPIGVTTAAMSTQATNAAINITGMAWAIQNNKNYRLSCEVPITLASTATLAFSLGNNTGGAPTSVSIDAQGLLGATVTFGEISALAQTTWAAAKTSTSGIVAGTTVARVWAQIQGSSTSGGTLTLQTWDIAGSGTIQVLANATCLLTQEN